MYCKKENFKPYKGEYLNAEKLEQIRKKILRVSNPIRENVQTLFY